MDVSHWLRTKSPIIRKDPLATTTIVEVQIVFKSIESWFSGTAFVVKSTKQSTCRVDLHDLSHQSESFKTNLGQILSTLEVDENLIDLFVGKIISRGQEQIREIRSEGNLIVLPVYMIRIEHVTMEEEAEEEENDLVMRESMVEFERTNYGRVGASAVALKSMMKVIQVEEVVNCGVCLEQVSVKGMVMPCEHMFHSDCIIKWLKESHLCPLCRYQMPTDQ